jgi:imidazolonepropionase
MKLIQTKGDVLTLAPVSAAVGVGRRPQERDLNIAKNLAFVVDKSGRIQWQGPRGKLPKDLRAKIKKEIVLPAGCYLPAFVECHTHLAFAGSRQHEFEMRNQGATYQQIAEKGGGIVSTVKATRQASKAQLLELATEKVGRFVRQGVAVIESKTGYGLNWQEEKKLLQVLLELQEKVSVEIVPTYLGPHAKSPDFASLDDYFEDIVTTHLPQLQKLGVRRADIFIEKGYFTPIQGARYVEALRGLGLGFSIHADQLSSLGSCSLGAQNGAQSVDHCVHATDADIRQLASSETVAVLLPAADFYIKIPFPPARKMVDAGVRVALATDFNPGSSPTQDLSLVGVLARLEMKMSLPEVLFGYTLNAAKAIGRDADFGSLQPGKMFNLTVSDCDWTELFYQVGYHPIIETWSRGSKIMKQS